MILDSFLQGALLSLESPSLSQIGVLSTTIADKKQTKIAKSDGTFTNEN